MNVGTPGHPPYVRLLKSGLLLLPACAFALICSLLLSPSSVIYAASSAYVRVTLQALFQ
jgi:hypothetical protein